MKLKKRIISLLEPIDFLIKKWVSEGKEVEERNFRVRNKVIRGCAISCQVLKLFKNKKITHEQAVAAMRYRRDFERSRKIILPQMSFDSLITDGGKPIDPENFFIKKGVLSAIAIQFVEKELHDMQINFDNFCIMSNRRKKDLKLFLILKMLVEKNISVSTVRFATKSRRVIEHDDSIYTRIEKVFEALERGYLNYDQWKKKDC